MAIRYCKSCVLPDTKPDLQFDENGVCSACQYYTNRKDVDWEKRKEEFLEITGKYKSKSGYYDCIVPVSGGKDSTYQLITLKRYGLNPLCVTATTDMLSDIGRKNIENIKLLGVDYIEVTTNPVVRRKINKIALTQVGDVSWPEHVTIFTIPIRIAVQMKIPLVVWGENSQNEYGGPAANADNHILNRRWLEEFGGLLGLRVSDLVGQEGIEKKDLIQYTYPTDDELAEVGVTGIFLGYYFKWDGLANALLSQMNGFTTYDKIVEGSVVNYENLDNCLHGIHDYFKFLKFGFGRSADIASLHIRRGRICREDAIEVVNRQDGQYPWEYLGCSLDEMLDHIGMTMEEFNRTCDRFTNKKIFLCDGSNQLVRDSKGNLTKINYDN